MFLSKLFASPEKVYFIEKAEGIQKAIWDIEFKIFKTREIREEVRIERENRLVNLDSCLKQLETPNLPEEAKKELEARVQTLKDDSDRFLVQIKGLDDEIEGAQPTEQKPEGIEGLNQRLDSFIELKGMVEDYIKTL